MADTPDPVAKLRDEAAADPSKVTQLLVEATVAPLSDEGKAALEKRPEFSPAFLQRQAREFGIPVDKIEEIAAQVIREGAPTLVVEAREFGVDAEAREHFRQIYDLEIAKRKKCNRWVHEPDAKTGKKEKRPCGAEFTTIQQALVHHSIHLLFESDYRTQRSHWNDVREILYPTQERGLRAALTPEERTKMLRDPEMRRRLLARG